MKGEGFTVWLTGYQGTGKRAISDELARFLVTRHVPVEQFDVRTPGLEVFQSADPTQTGRYERRLGFLATALNRHGVAVIVTTMSPSRELRETLRQDIPRFVEVYVKRSQPPAGQHYEEPLQPDVEVPANTENASEWIERAREHTVLRPRNACQIVCTSC